LVTATEILTDQFTASSTKLLQVLDGIGDEEFFWEPCEGCWTLHLRSELRTKRPDGSGEWVLDGEWDPPPKVAPFTTIAWRAGHIAAVNYLYWDYAFGPAALTFDLEFPGNAAGTIEWLAASQQPLLETLAGLDDGKLDDLVRTNWGDQWPISRIFKTLINEQVHHGAEISLLRDLYRNRGTLRV
jgi:hypothetical protein